MARLGAIVALALGFVMLRACAWVVESEPGNAVRIMLQPVSWPSGPGSLTRVDGADVHIERAYLAWTRATLVLCDDAIQTARWPPRLPMLSGASAHAHTSASPWVVEGPSVVSLIGPRATELGTIAAPTGRYCKLVVSFDAALADALGTPTDVAMTGRTLFIDGYFRASRTAVWQELRLDESAAFDVSVDLGEDGVDIADGDALAVTIAVDADSWFDGVTPGAPDAARRMLENLRASLQATVE